MFKIGDIVRTNDFFNENFTTIDSGDGVINVSEFKDKPLIIIISKNNKYVCETINRIHRIQLYDDEIELDKIHYRKLKLEKLLNNDI